VVLHQAARRWAGQARCGGRRGAEHPV